MNIAGAPAKPSRTVKVGDVIIVIVGNVTRTVRVLELLEQRVGAAKVPEFMEDLTPPQEFAKGRTQAANGAGLRPKGTGRPTKRDRRILQRFFD